MQHGSLQNFQLLLGQALVCYKSAEEAHRAQRALTMCQIGGAPLNVDLVSETDAVRLQEAAAQAGAGPLPGAQRVANAALASLWSPPLPPPTPSAFGSAAVVPTHAPRMVHPSLGEGPRAAPSHLGVGTSVWGSGGSVWASPPIAEHQTQQQAMMGPSHAGER